MSLMPLFYVYAEHVLRVRRNISHVTARAEMTSTLVSSIHSERSRRLCHRHSLWARRPSIREETYWCSITTRERACIQLTGRSVEIILFIAIFQAWSTAKMYAVRTVKLFAVATTCPATLKYIVPRAGKSKHTVFVVDFIAQ